MKDLIIVGAGGFGREVLDTIKEINKANYVFNVLGFLDDNFDLNHSIAGHNVLGGVNDITKFSNKDVGIVLAIGKSDARRKIVKRYNKSIDWQTIIHPSAIISNDSFIGKGCIIQAFCIVASNSKIGDFLVMNAHSGCGHDTKIGKFCSIMSFCDVAGDSVVGDSVFMGTGSKVIPNIVVKKNSYLCAGSVIMKDVNISSKLIGNPAKTIEVFENETWC